MKAEDYLEAVFIDAINGLAQFRILFTKNVAYTHGSDKVVGDLRCYVSEVKHPVGLETKTPLFWCTDCHEYQCEHVSLVTKLNRNQSASIAETLATAEVLSMAEVLTEAETFPETDCDVINTIGNRESTRELARRARDWVNSEEGQKAILEALQSAKEMTDALDLQRKVYIDPHACYR